MEAAATLVQAVLWFAHLTIRDGAPPDRLLRPRPHWDAGDLKLDAAKDFAAPIRAGIQKHVSHELVAEVRAHALAELAAIPVASDENTSDDQAVAKQVVAELKPAERRWLKALGELLADGKQEIGHAMIAARLGITVSTSQEMPRRLRAHGLIPPEPPITNNSSFVLTSLGWTVFALVSEVG